MYKIVFVVAVFAFALQGALSSPVADNEVNNIVPLCIDKYCRARWKWDTFVFRKNYVFVPIGEISSFTPIYDVKKFIKTHLKKKF